MRSRGQQLGGRRLGADLVQGIRGRQVSVRGKSCQETYSSIVGTQRGTTTRLAICGLAPVGHCGPRRFITKTRSGQGAKEGIRFGRSYLSSRLCDLSCLSQLVTGEAGYRGALALMASTGSPSRSTSDRARCVLVVAVTRAGCGDRHPAIIRRISGRAQRHPGGKSLPNCCRNPLTVNSL